MNLQALDKFHKTRLGYLVFGFVELAMSYGFASWALSGGNLLDWILAAALLLGFAQNGGRFVLTYIRPQSQTTKPTKKAKR